MKKQLLASLAFIGITLTSCDFGGTKVEPTPVELSYYSESRVAQILYNDIVNQAMALTKLRVDNPSGTADPTGTVISSIENGQMTVTYNENEVSRRLGKLKITFTGTPLAEGSSMQIVPEDLSYSGLKISGTISVDILPKGSMKAKQDIVVEGGRLLDALGVEVSFSCNLTREQSEGASSQISTDDIYSFTGYFSGVLTNKTPYALNIVEPISLGYGSGYFKSGKVTMRPSTYTDAYTITFGQGEYLNEVLLTYQGVAKLYRI